MLRVALTGGIATGKSYCLARFAALGLPVIDADRLSRDAVAPGSAALEAVRTRFGSQIIAADGTLNRRALAAIVFPDPAARRDLEAIVHPHVRAALEAWFATLRADAIAVAEIPLLFETAREDRFDRVVVAACPPEVQLERLAARGLSPEDARARLASQIPIAEKAARADDVIDTSGTMAETDRQVLRVLRTLQEGSKRS